MRIERSIDEQMIRSIVSHAEIKPHIWEGEGEPEVPMHESVYYLLGIEDVAVGVVAFVPMNPVTWMPHIAALPGREGRGSELLRLATQWMFKNTPCRKAFAALPAFNARVIRVFEKCDFRLEGVSPKSFEWHGHLHGQLLMGKECDGNMAAR